jgi:hypothetical protein
MMDGERRIAAGTIDPNTMLRITEIVE